MNENVVAPAEFDGALFNENIAQFPPQQLALYAGKRVAWSRDGRRILADGRDYAELGDALKAAGIDLGDVVLGYVPADDEDSLLL